MGGKKRGDGERDFHGKRCVRSRKATSPPSTEKVFARSKGKRFSKWRRWYKSRERSKWNRWAHNASMPTPFLLLSPPPLLRVSRLSRKWRKLFIVVHFSRGWRKREHQSMRILFVSNVFQLSFSSINLILSLLYLSLDGVQSDKPLQRFWED